VGGRAKAKGGKSFCRLLQGKKGVMTPKDEGLQAPEAPAKKKDRGKKRSATS